ncbi:MAG TPA: hypothetical protein VH637_02040 [Streptosporangiaceae bacterium]|jgi:hypothetical protein
MFVLLQDRGCPVIRRVRWRDRMQVRLRARRLDAELARGACPDGTVVLALRARQLTGMRARRHLARAVRRVLAAATGRPRARLPVPVCQDQVARSAPEFSELICGLLSACPVSARGVACASVLLGDGGGPLYHRACPDDLRARVREAASALSPLAG